MRTPDTTRSHRLLLALAAAWIAISMAIGSTTVAEEPSTVISTATTADHATPIR
jgi:hypothetical protein